LAELVFTEVLRLHLAQAADDELTGWLAALRDPVVGRALALMHAEPAKDWTVDDLARGAAASRTVLTDRFNELLGKPPMRYLGDWRLDLASGLLRRTALSVGQVSSRVGYAAEESFSRAFKKRFGHAPGQWRSMHP
jgi:transcriptional regulator GlxA family with amidase domain